MREFTDQERDTRDRRKLRFPAFCQESGPVLQDFFTRLGCPEPTAVLNEPERFLPFLDFWMRDQDIALEDRTWILTRLGYFIGQFFLIRFSGSWLLNEIPDSRFFLRFVVGQFGQLRNPRAMIDPFQIADEYISSPPGRSLISIIAEVEQELVASQENGGPEKRGQKRGYSSFWE
jgi:hypothetical protein